jgi:hypothetical protein
MIKKSAGGGIISNIEAQGKRSLRTVPVCGCFPFAYACDEARFNIAGFRLFVLLVN